MKRKMRDDPIHTGSRHYVKRILLSIAIISTKRSVMEFFYLENMEVVYWYSGMAGLKQNLVSIGYW